MQMMKSCQKEAQLQTGMTVNTEKLSRNKIKMMDKKVNSYGLLKLPGLQFFISLAEKSGIIGKCEKAS
jgi:hypothetical protein